MGIEQSTVARSVLMTADTKGGLAPAALSLARSLAEHDVRVVLATTGDPLGEEPRDAARRSSGLEVIESRFRVEWMDDLRGDVARAAEWLLAIEDRTHPTVVHLEGYCLATTSFRAPKLLVVRSSFSAAFIARFGEGHPRFEAYRRQVVRALRAADAIVTSNAALRDELALHYDGWARVEVLPAALEQEGRAGDSVPEAARQAYESLYAAMLTRRAEPRAKRARRR